MAQPNIVREPSMDEILASIRRIIESNEPVMQAGVATAMAEPEGFSGRPANDDLEEVPLTVDAVFANREDDRRYNSEYALRSIAEADMRQEASVIEDRRETNFAWQTAAPAPQKSLSLADVAARVRAASERSTVFRDHNVQPQSISEEPAEVVAPEPAQEMLVAAPDVPQTDYRYEERQEFFSRPDADVTQAQPDDGNTLRPEPVSLLSSSAGEQVARSFHDLAIAIDNAERRSLDQIAEDMLKPMLQEWLDDNLPTLVERLVREEIERVARGPRR